ncbi:sialic acid synthase [Planctomycetales bacterium]|nr:sialic acid synthase [Planctomycetales bacterium]GHT01138.1 sialic acid synthase [Planctomycetales bacterium]GHT03229.1 sialic acid synthase [Planctomycetales bacterium]
MNRQINLGDRLVGDNEAVYFIAEIGINHNGDLQAAKKLLDATFATDWDCAKFQKRTPDICVPEKQKSVLRQTPWGEMTYLAYRRRVEFQKAEYDIIDRYCREKPLTWTASVWDLPSLEFLAAYKTPFIKIPSAKITDLELVEESAKLGKPVFLSTGMSTLEEIDAAVNLLEKHLTKNYLLFHVNSTYPAKLDELNLSVIGTLKERYDCLVGYSGHEQELMPSQIASIYGACAIERHITLDHTMWGSDQAASLELHGMDLLVKRVRATKKIIGNGVKIITDGEMKIREKLRG